MAELVGLLKVKYDTQVVSEKFKKRDFVLTTDFDSQYPQDVIMQVTQDKCLILDAIALGAMVKVQINIRGREWNGPQGVKYFNTLEVWRVDVVPSGNNTTPPPAQNVQQTPPAPVFNTPANDNDDLPF